MKVPVILLLPATVNRHKSALFERNCIRLGEQPRRYKPYANAPQRYVICTWPILFIIIVLIC